jgi:hypothetical protein
MVIVGLMLILLIALYLATGFCTIVGIAQLFGVGLFTASLITLASMILAYFISYAATCVYFYARRNA